MAKIYEAGVPTAEQWHAVWRKGKHKFGTKEIDIDFFFKKESQDWTLGLHQTEFKRCEWIKVVWNRLMGRTFVKTMMKLKRAALVCH